MARKSQHKHRGPRPTRGHYPTPQATTTGNDRADAVAKAKTIEELVAPVFSFPFTAIYPSELEISDFEDVHGIIVENVMQTTAQDQKYYNYENQIQYSYATVARSWDQQSQVQEGRYSNQNQTPFTEWESQVPVEEPFNGVGEVAFDSAGPRQGNGYDGELRRRNGQKEGKF